MSGVVVGNPDALYTDEHYLVIARESALWLAGDYLTAADMRASE